MTAAIEIEHLWVKYGGHSAVRGLDLAIAEGEVFGLIGPNGAGKTSTIRVLATLLAPTQGRARVGGCDVVRDPGGVRARIGYVPDRFGTYPGLTAEDYLQFFAAVQGIPRRSREGLIRDALALTDLTAKRGAPVEGLSLGMKQRLAIARVLLHDPGILLLDEPGEGLDPRSRIELRELLKELRRMGKTILISSHILHELAQLCTSIGIIDGGKLAASGSIAELVERFDLRRQVRLQAANLDEALLKRVRELPAVAHAEPTPDGALLRVREGPTAIEDLHRDLVGLGARLRMFQPDAIDLEAVFLKLTAREPPRPSSGKPEVIDAGIDISLEADDVPGTGGA
jgi:ABC-2 type transport system ATP-binding protein